MIGKKIGNFQIVREVGKGGMGAVYEARHETIGQRVAIKVLHPNYAQRPDQAARFFDEARAASQIAHEGIVKVYDFGPLEGGASYLIMDLLRGESLRAHLKREGALPVDHSLRITAQIASALAAAHAIGVIHRDLKPDNLFLVVDSAAPGGQRAKVLDFGVAKVRLIGAPDPIEGAVPTTSAVVLGTPLYMAPEQSRGSGRVTGAADVYALGVILYEMLAARPPFQGPNFGALVLAHALDEPPSLQQARPELPHAVVTLVQQLLEKEPEKRPTMAVLEGRVAQLLAGLKAPAGQAVKVAPRWPLGVLGLALGLTLGLLVVIAALLLRARSHGVPEHLPGIGSAPPAATDLGSPPLVTGALGTSAEPHRTEALPKQPAPLRPPSAPPAAAPRRRPPVISRPRQIESLPDPPSEPE